MANLPRAPLAFALTQICFAPILNMEEYVTKIQSELRKSYPLFEPDVMQSITIPAAMAGVPVNGAINLQRRWSFVNRERTEAVVLAPDFLVLQATVYECHDIFLEKLKAVAATVCRHADIRYVSRLGVRYVDLLRTINGVTPRNLLRDSLRMDALNGMFADQSFAFSAVEGKTKCGRIRINIFDGCDGPFLPQDLQPTIRLNFKETPEPRERFVVFDTDHIAEFDAAVDFDVDDICSRFKQLHDLGISVAFKAATTDEARKLWSTES